MGKIINVSINLSDIDRKFIVHGKKGEYLNLVLRETKDDRYGNDYMVVQGIPKPQRKEGVRGPILGNGKNFHFTDDRDETSGGGRSASQRSESSPAASSSPPTPAADDIDEAVPF